MKKHPAMTIILFGLLLFSWGMVSQAGDDGNDSSGIAAVKSFFLNCRLQKEITHINLTIIPVMAPEKKMKTNIATMDEMIKKGKLIIKEISQSGSVNSLSLQNKSDHYVFIMAGEILSGSKQDRILQQDVILPPNSNKTIVPAFCVEQGRWQYRSGKFFSKKLNAPIAIRQVAKVRKDQSRVWQEVNDNNQSMAATSQTSNLAATYESEKTKKEKSKYWQHFIDIPANHPQCNGVIVLVNNKVMVADFFANKRIFKKLWDKLLESYVAEAIRRQKKDVFSQINNGEMLMKICSKANIKLADSPGSGTQVDISSSVLKGAGILLKNIPIHIDLFPNVGPQIPEKMNRLERNYQQRRRNP